MPKRETVFTRPTLRTDERLVSRLADELKSPGESGQPVICERNLSSGRIHVTVIWDDWDHLTLEERTEIIFRAYERNENPGVRDWIALASGLTMPEAHAAGMLPYQIIAAVRKSDPVGLKDCHEAMIQEGASTLFDSDRPQLRFASKDEAEAALKRLSNRLPESEPVWTITKEVGRVEDWYSEH